MSVSNCGFIRGRSIELLTPKPSTYLLPRNGAREALWSGEHCAAESALLADVEGGGPRRAEMTVLLGRG